MKSRKTPARKGYRAPRCGAALKSNCGSLIVKVKKSLKSACALLCNHVRISLLNLAVASAGREISTSLVVRTVRRRNSIAYPPFKSHGATLRKETSKRSKDTCRHRRCKSAFSAVEMALSRVSKTMRKAAAVVYCRGWSLRGLRPARRNSGSLSQ